MTFCASQTSQVPLAHELSWIDPVSGPPPANGPIRRQGGPINAIRMRCFLGEGSVLDRAPGAATPDLQSASAGSPDLLARTCRLPAGAPDQRRPSSTEEHNMFGLMM